MIIYTPLHKIIAQFAHLYIQMQKQKKRKASPAPFYKRNISIASW